MRAFGARADTTCLDEPFFATFLHKTGLDHPGRRETLVACETNATRIAARITKPVATPYHFQKHMAHHMIDGVPNNWMAEARHVLLLRHPARVIASYAKGRPNFTADDLGFSALRNVRDHIYELTGAYPMIIDSDDILADPARALRDICETGFGIPFDPTMLTWEAGPRPEDGPWAPYWYKNVIASKGFMAPPKGMPSVNSEHQKIYEHCLADYKALRAGV